MIVETIGHQDPAVGQECHVLRLGEVRGVVAGHVLLAQCLQQRAAVVGEDVDLMEGLVDDPDPPLGVVRADTQSMWSWAVGAFA